MLVITVARSSSDGDCCGVVSADFSEGAVPWLSSSSALEIGVSVMSIEELLPRVSAFQRHLDSNANALRFLF
jgi:hypothetical protein